MKGYRVLKSIRERKTILLPGTAILLALALLAGIAGCSAAPTAPVPPAPGPAQPVPTITATPPRPAPSLTAIPSPSPKPTVPPPVTGVPAPAPTFTVPPPITAPAPAQPRAYPTPTPTPTPKPGYQQSPNIGFSAGGAKDIENFRVNIKNNYLPLPTDVTYEGLFYDYYFETGQMEPSRKLFSPSYSYAVTRDPFSGKAEYYLSVGLNSGMKESDFQRKKLNLVIVLDKSGSMGEQFNRYYYDRFGNPVRREDAGEEFTMTKMRSATESVATILDHLNAGDRFGLVEFNQDAYLAKSLRSLDDVDIDGMKQDILRISADGNTNLMAGIRMGTQLFKDFLNADPAKYENRMIILTDAQPNTGDTGENSFLGMLQRNASNRVFTTVIGIGVDFNTGLIESIMKEKGANYYSVHSPREFAQRMDEEFDFMVTPLVFDLQLKLEATGWKIDKVFGSPEADEATGHLMSISTLFPSKTVGGETKGGLVLLKLRKVSAGNTLRLKVSYEDRNGKRDSSESTIMLEGTSPEFFDNSGIRKGVLLTRYAALLKDWMIDERDHLQYSKPWEPGVDRDVGIVLPPPDRSLLGRWERQSMPLTVSSPYRRLFAEFADYFQAEMRAIGDRTLSQELEILEKLSAGRG